MNERLAVEKKPIGDVDGDALLALGFETVDEQGEIEILAGRTVARRILGERGELIFENQFRIVEQPPDQSGLAVIHRAAGDEAKQILGLAGSQRALETEVHQKYPSRFFFSIDAASSVSISRPWRSETRAVSISATISASVVAGNSMAPVSG